MAVPNTFATATSAIPLANLDANFAYYDGAFSISGTATTFAGSVTLTSGTANGVAYLNGSKVLTTGSALTFDGSRVALSTATSNIQLTTTVNTNQAFISLADADGRTAVFRGPNSGTPNCAQIGTTTNHDTAFLYGNSEQMRLTSTGLGIGTSSPAAKLDVKGGTTISTLAGWNTLSNSMFELANPAVRFGIGYDSSDQVLLQGFDSSNAARNIGMQVYGGNVGIGTSSPGAKLQVAGTAKIGEGVASNTSKLMVNTVSGVAAGIQLFQDSVESWIIQNPASSTALTFSNSGTERVRIDGSGNLLVGTTSGITSGGIVIQPVAGQSTIYIGHITGTGSGASYEEYYYAGTKIGSITQSGTTAVLYNVTSDQRLKENIQDAESASALIDALQVRQFDWKTDNTHQRYGFVAQELVTVAPEAVHQPVNEEEMMAVDYSKLVPMLVKEIQSLRKRLADAGIA